MFSYHTHVSPFPQAVVGPYSNSPQNQTLPSSALILGSPFHPSAPDVSTSLPAPGVPSKVPNPKKKSKPGYCVNCYTTETSQWRRHPESKDQLCNYCGQKAYKGELLKQEPQ
ncbi:hypothetical protein C8R45DRAFT_988895 [Mycena sanguinolenta]|nr:hypothetical protein C8R45DRAFT_988895 [Mycena sanguinolenta]